MKDFTIPVPGWFAQYGRQLSAAIIEGKGLAHDVWIHPDGTHVEFVGFSDGGKMARFRREDDEVMRIVRSDVFFRKYRQEGAPNAPLPEQVRARKGRSRKDRPDREAPAGERRASANSRGA